MNQETSLLIYKIARLAIDGDIHIYGSDDFIEYLRLSNALVKRVGAGAARDLVDARIDELKEEPNGLR